MALQRTKMRKLATEDFFYRITVGKERFDKGNDAQSRLDFLRRCFANVQEVKIKISREHLKIISCMFCCSR